MMIRILGILALVSLGACIAQLPWAPQERLDRAAYTHPGPKTVTLLTVMAANGKSAGHSSLLINASQRVLYDPAGTYYYKEVPERADMLYGMNPKMLQYYLDYHARKGFYVQMQTKTLSPAAAEKLMRDAIAAGASMNAMCASNTSRLLSGTPGFEGFPQSLWPKSAVEAFARLPGVTSQRIIQDDEGKDLKR